MRVRREESQRRKKRACHRCRRSASGIGSAVAMVAMDASFLIGDVPFWVVVLRGHLSPSPMHSRFSGNPSKDFCKKKILSIKKALGRTKELGSPNESVGIADLELMAAMARTVSKD